jgi:2Fe-2S ferredoxin
LSATVTFRDPHIELEVELGLTLLEAAELAGAPVGSLCGGVAGCASCHVRIEQGAEHLSVPDESEEDGLDRVFDAREGSRLACQAKIVSAGQIVVRVTDESVDSWLREHPEKRR